MTPRRRVATPPGVPVVVDPAATLAFYRKLLDLAYEKDPASVDPLLADLFDEGEVHGAAAERAAAAARRDAVLAERSNVLELAARQVQRRDQEIRELKARIAELEPAPAAAPAQPALTYHPFDPAVRA